MYIVPSDHSYPQPSVSSLIPSPHPCPFALSCDLLSLIRAVSVLLVWKYSSEPGELKGTPALPDCWQPSGSRVRGRAPQAPPLPMTGCWYSWFWAVALCSCLWRLCRAQRMPLHSDSSRYLAFTPPTHPSSMVSPEPRGLVVVYIHVLFRTEHSTLAYSPNCEDPIDCNVGCCHSLSHGDHQA